MNISRSAFKFTEPLREIRSFSFGDFTFLKRSFLVNGIQSTLCVRTIFLFNKFSFVKAAEEYKELIENNYNKMKYIMSSLIK